MLAGDQTQVRQIMTGDSFAAQHAPVAYFGLGDLTSVDRLTVVWPDGNEEVISRPAVDQYHQLSTANDVSN